MNRDELVFGSNLVFIIGAPRSGTNMLRDVITSFDGGETWPCDEINYILRHGNVRFKSDEFPPELARKSVKRYLRRIFEDFSKEKNARFLVEKTCANSLRISFLNEIFPRAKFIFIYRDGVDATGSARLRWTAKFDLRYILKKVRFVPLTDLPYYGIRYLGARLHRFFSKENRLAFWGPALDNMQGIVSNHSLNEVCAIQWQQCVEKSEEGLSKIESERIHRLSYEGFVNAPAHELGKILEFVGVEAGAGEIELAIGNVSNRSLGKGRASLGEGEVKKLEALVGTTLKKYGYL
ncbi:MAG: sulfotransferase [Colwellia sp.]|nr:sulfotransferase [Colwellia sp.]